MSLSHLPEGLQTLAAGYVLGDLSSEEMAEFQQRLQAQPELAQFVTSLQRTLSMLPEGLPPQIPDAAVKSRLLSAAQRSLSASPGSSQAPVQAASVPSLPPPRGQCRRSWTTPIAASLMLLLGGYSIWLTARVTGLQARLAASERFVEMMIAQQSLPSPALTISPAGTFLHQQWSGLAQLVQDHQGSLVRSQGPVDVAATDLEQLSAQISLGSQLPMLTSAKAQLLGGSRCQFGQAQGVRLTYELPGDKPLSVYQIDLNGTQFPEFPETHITLRDQATHLLLWRENNYLYALTAEIPLADLKILAQTLELI